MSPHAYKHTLPKDFSLEGRARKATKLTQEILRLMVATVSAWPQEEWDKVAASARVSSPKTSKAVVIENLERLRMIQGVL